MEWCASSGAQIDLLFDRNDDAITLCEIKYADKPFVIDKTTAKAIANKADVFLSQTKTKKQLFTVLITTCGLKANLWSEDIVDAEVTLEDLF